MKFPAVGALLRFPQLMLLMALVFSAPAWAQFEIAPDHFDANTTADKKQPAKAKPVKRANQSASLSAKTNEKHEAGFSQTDVASGNHTINSSVAAGQHRDSGKNPTSSGKTAAAGRKRTATKKVTLASTR